MPLLVQTILLLVVSNVFMTLAWYGHLGKLSEKPAYLAVAVSWMIALVEYAFQVPANRLGHTQYSMAQLKILQEVIALSVFVPVAVFLLGERFRWDYVWAAACMLAAVFFMFRGQGQSGLSPTGHAEPSSARSADNAHDST